MGAKSSACHWPTFYRTLRNPSRRFPHQHVGFGGVYPRPKGEGTFVATLLLLWLEVHMFVKHLLPRMTRLPSEMSRNWGMLRFMALMWDLWLTGPEKCNFQCVDWNAWAVREATKLPNSFLGYWPARAHAVCSCAVMRSSLFVMRPKFYALNYFPTQF